MNDLDGEHDDAADLYQQILTNPKRVGAVVWLRYGAACMELGRSICM